MAPVTPTKADKAKKLAEIAEATRGIAALRVNEVPKLPSRDAGSAIDDTDDVDSDYAKRQKSLTQQRRAEKRGLKVVSFQDVLPFKAVPIVLPLSLRHLESVVALERASFTNPEHRAKQETVSPDCPSHLEFPQTCPGLCFGLFCTVNPAEAEAKGWDIETLSTAHEVETGRQNGAKHVLLACVIATKTLGSRITDGDMACPEKWKELKGMSTDIGHQKCGRTIAIHSVAVAPKLQGHGLGKLILKSYLQHMNSAGMGDRVIVRCQYHNIYFFEKFSFLYTGPSSALTGGLGFHDLVSPSLLSRLH
ncbi:hypothetical protein GQ53DRAFT_722732 [Thozetella sp. PMI_491]|nr:hypothetical protein GQ53DRAFT_722732 [Thozetella sp. PMI_491]